jgi:hypothetical protein
VTGAFFNTVDPFARTFTGNGLFFNLWAGPFGANAEGCSRSFSGDAVAVSAVMDGRAILHENAFRDCASISPGGEGSTEATATDPAWLLTHESGHFLFALSDEYAGGGYSTSQSCLNAYASEAACQVAAPGVGASASQCAQIGSTGFWRIVNADETMSDRTLSSDWRDDSDGCVSARFAGCYAGTCY